MSKDVDENELLQNGEEPVKEACKARMKYGVVLDDTFQTIKQMMYNNQLVPGQKIIYGDLAKKLKTSVTPIIQALKRLESLKIVEYFPNKGYFVTEITEEELKKLCEAREALELFLLPKVIQNITPDAIASIREHFKKLDMSDPTKWVILDGQFHLKIAEFAGNDVIYRMLEDVLERIYLRYKPQHLSEQRFKHALKEHKEILNALVTKDLKLLRKVIRKHIYHQLDYTIIYMLK